MGSCWQGEDNNMECSPENGYKRAPRTEYVAYEVDSFHCSKHADYCLRDVKSCRFAGRYQTTRRYDSEYHQLFRTCTELNIED
jgi:hypothetical protein